MGSIFAKTQVQQDRKEKTTDKSQIDWLFKKASNIDLYRILTPLTNEQKISLNVLYKMSMSKAVNFSLFSLADMKKWFTSLKFKNLSADECKLQYVDLCRKIKSIEISKQIKESIKPSNFWNFEDEYKSRNFKNHQLIPLIHEGFISILPNQIPIDVLDAYFHNSREKFINIQRGKIFLDHVGERKPRRIKECEFQFMITQTLFSKMIYELNEISESDCAHYMKLFNIENKDGHFILDTTVIRATNVRKEDDVWIAPSVILLKRDTITDDLKILAIAAENLNDVHSFPPDVNFPDTLKTLFVLYPNDGLAWEIAKIHTLHNLIYATGGEHAIVHFSLSDSVALCSLVLRHDSISKQSILSKILLQHTYLQVPVDSYVLHHKESPLFLESAPYFAWDAKYENGSSKNVLLLVMNGWKGHPIYRSSRDLFETQPHKNIGNYRKLIWELQQLVDEWVENMFQIFSNDENEIEFMRLFTKKLWDMLPSESFLRFQHKDPNKTSLTNEEIIEFFKKLVSFTIHNSIEHSLNHSSLENHLITRLSQLIIRKPVPFNDKNTDLGHINNEIETINRPHERGRALMAFNMIFHNHPSLTLQEFFKVQGGHFKSCSHQYVDYLRRYEADYSAKLEKLLDSEISHEAFSQVAISIQS